MTPCDVVRAGIDLEAEMVVPMHYGLWKRTWEDPHLVELVAERWRAPLKAVIVRLGDPITITAQHTSP